MPSLSSPRQWPRSPLNELHKAARDGSTERLVTLLSDGSIDIDQGDEHGGTPLILASYNNRSGIVRILLDNGGQRINSG